MNKKHHNPPIHPTSLEVIHEAIASKAYELWLRADKPDNQADVYWLEAEKQLISEQSELRKKSG